MIRLLKVVVGDHHLALPLASVRRIERRPAPGAEQGVHTLHLAANGIEGTYDVAGVLGSEDAELVPLAPGLWPHLPWLGVATLSQGATLVLDPERLLRGTRRSQHRAGYLAERRSDCTTPDGAMAPAAAEPAGGATLLSGPAGPVLYGDAGPFRLRGRRLRFGLPLAGCTAAREAEPIIPVPGCPAAVAGVALVSVSGQRQAVPVLHAASLLVTGPLSARVPHRAHGGVLDATQAHSAHHISCSGPARSANPAYHAGPVDPVDPAHPSQPTHTGHSVLVRCGNRAAVIHLRRVLAVDRSRHLAPAGTLAPLGHPALAGAILLPTEWIAVHDPARLLDAAWAADAMPEAPLAHPAPHAYHPNQGAEWDSAPIPSAQPPSFVLLAGT